MIVQAYQERGASREADLKRLKDAHHYIKARWWAHATIDLMHSAAVGHLCFSTRVLDQIEQMLPEGECEGKSWEQIFREQTTEQWFAELLWAFGIEDEQDEDKERADTPESAGRAGQEQD